MESTKSISKNAKLLFLFLFLGSIVTAQNFKLLRYDENYESLKDSARNFYGKLKFVPLNREKNFYLSFGGEARYEYVYFNNEDWGKFNFGSNHFLLQRYDFHTDIHLGKTFRVFAQLRSALQDGRVDGVKSTDQDQLNVQNLFLDVNIYQKEKQKITLRSGIQELDYGSGRLISVQEGKNDRLYFTGGKIMYSSESLFIDAFAMMQSKVNSGVFDNKISEELNLWGVYSKIIIPKSGNVDFYYLGIRRNKSVFEEGIAPERRHTIGTRFWKYGSGFIYNLEAAYQFGKFGSGNINAWTGSVDVGYLFENSRFKPTINLRNDYISGDQNQGNGNLQTFNPLFPKGGYFGFNPQIGPVNLIDIHPYATIDLLPSLQLQLDVVFNWRFSLEDGVYRPGGSLNHLGSMSDQRYIGTAYLAGLTYNINKYISVSNGFQYFKTGAFINDIIPNSKDGLFFNVQLGFKF